MFFDNNTTLLGKLNLDKNHCVLLQESMFYYCCGKDPSPIIEFKEQYPLYIYVDKRNYSEELYDRLTKQSFKLNIKKELFIDDFLFTSFTEWSYNSNKFYLIYIQDDACKVFKNIYKSILPKCICNYRYEMTNRHVLETAEHKVSYILGHCFNEDFIKVKEIDYYGDYNFNRKTKITLHKKIELTY